MSLKNIVPLILFSFMASMNISCSSLFYYPQKNVKFYDPAQFNIKEQDIWIGDTHGWWFESKTKPAKGTIIFFHGNAENLTSHFSSLAWLPDQGYNYFIFDYPGYGLSPGEPNPKSCVEAGKAVLSWIYENKDKSPLIIYGQSLGGIVALRTVEEMRDKVPIRAIIADSTFSSFQRIARRKLGMSWITCLFQPMAYVVLSDSQAPKKLDKLAPIPILVIHGQADVIVEPVNGEDVFKEASDPKQIWRIPDGRHGDTFWRHDLGYRKKLIDFLDKGIW